VIRDGSGAPIRALDEPQFKPWFKLFRRLRSPSRDQLLRVWFVASVTVSSAVAAGPEHPDHVLLPKAVYADLRAVIAKRGRP
jgi:hypothetical protein